MAGPGVRPVCSVAILIVLASGAVPRAARQARPAEDSLARPNLLLVTFDTTRADRLPPYGYAHARTPALDRLAREGVVFTRAYAPAVQTLPSHASLLTGLHPITINVVSNGQRLGGEALTLAELLRAEGYRTGAIVATAPLMEVFGLSQGFETYDDNFEESPFSRAFKSLFRLFTSHRVNIRTTRPAHRVAALGRRWLGRAARDGRPFFLWLHFIEPHSPYDRHPDFARPEWAVSDGRTNRYGEKEENYVSEIEFADHYLGTVLERLDRLGLTERTLVVFAADHGESLGEGGYTGHRGEVYERIIRVPLVFRMPGAIPAGRRIGLPVQLPDVAPTALRLLGVSVGDGAFQGRDLFADRVEPRRLYSVAAEILTRSPIRIAAIDGDRKFVYWPESGAQALFDLRADPGEARNLLAATAAPGGRATDVAWVAELKAWWEENDRLRADGFRLDEEHVERLRSLGYVR